MNIAIDISPLQNTSLLAHRVRGTGFYIENLRGSLLKYFPENKYIFFTRGEKLPKNVDLVHYPYFEPFFRTLPIVRRYKTVVTVHDLTPLVFPKEFPPGIRGNLKWQIQKRALKRTDTIITDSESSKKDIVKYTGISSSKINVICLAAGKGFRKMEDGRWKMEIREKYNLPDKFVLYVGDVTWNKNLPRLVKAIQKMDVPLVMVGDALSKKDFDKTNPWNQDLATVRELVHKDKNILTLGFVPTEGLVMLYNKASVFVMPSFYEGFGLPILEAMSCGCPVVTTKGGSIPEVAENAAHYVDPYDVNNIANGIGKVYFNQKLQRELSQRGLKQAQKFTWRKTSEETINAYKRAVD